MNATILGRTPRSLVLLASCVLVAACQGLPERRGATVVGGSPSAGALEKRNPSEIVVAPIIDESANPKTPLAMLREEFHSGLVKRRYSPLALEYVDGRIVDGIYSPGTLGEDAVLTIVIENWDTTYWDSTDALLLRAEVRMTDSSNGELLWSGRVDRRFDFVSIRSRYSTQSRYMREVCSTIAGEILAALPPRVARPTASTGS